MSLWMMNSGPSNHETFGIPSTRYQVLPSRNLSLSSKILHIPATEPKLLASHGGPLDNQHSFIYSTSSSDTAANFPPQIDLAYTEHLNEGFIPVKHPHIHVSTPSFCFLPMLTKALPAQPCYKVAPQA